MTGAPVDVGQPGQARPDTPGRTAAEPAGSLPAGPVVDWLVLTRPGRWLFATGRAELATPLWEHPQLVRPAEIEGLVPMLRGAALQTRADAQAVEAQVAQMVDQRSGRSSGELWGRVRGETWTEAGRAARWRLRVAASVAGTFLGQPGRTAMEARTYGEHPPLDEPWALVADVAFHAARVVAWTAIGRGITAQPQGFDPRMPRRAREVAKTTASAALAPVLAQLDTDAQAAGIHWDGA